jgi:peroxiredoxin
MLRRWLPALSGKTDGEMTHVDAGTIAPVFSLKDLGGREYSLLSLLIKGPVVAVFFKISCPVCQFTLPFIERLYKSYRDVATLLGISQDDGKATQKFADQYGVTFPILLDGMGYPASNAYGLFSVPTVFLIDTDRTAKIVCLGFEKKGLEDIAATLAERKQVRPAALFRPDEKIPAHRPG